MDEPVHPDPQVEQVLALFAREAGIDRARLRLDTRADELGIGSLDLALALFEIEDRFGVRLPELPPGAPQPTLGELVQQVRSAPQQTAAGPA